jgi:hypothetical protein
MQRIYDKLSEDQELLAGFTTTPIASGYRRQRYPFLPFLPRNYCPIITHKGSRSCGLGCLVNLFPLVSILIFFSHEKGFLPGQEQPLHSAPQSLVAQEHQCYSQNSVHSLSGPIYRLSVFSLFVGSGKLTQDEQPKPQFCPPHHASSSQHNALLPY